MNNILRGINSEAFTLSAIVIGFLLIDDSTPAEQNSLGNWFMMIGQVLCTNSSQQQVLNNNNNQSNNTNQSVINGNISDSQTNNFNQNNYSNYNTNQNYSDTQQQINTINKVIKAMQQEIDNLNR